MIPGHPYLGLVVPPVERLPFAVGLGVVAAVMGYLLVRGLIAYAAWREQHGTVEIVKQE